MKHYHYIFAGSGLSALMTVYKMVQAGKLNDKPILLLDSSNKQQNDRTWCFWEKGNGKWDTIASKQWNSAWFHGNDFKKELKFGSYKYKMVKGIDFYSHILSTLNNYSNITIVHQK